MEHRITDIHCPQCGAPADFDIVRQMYVCGHCGGTVGISEAQKEKQGFRKLQREKLKDSVKKYKLFSTSCSGCGAEVVFEENEALSGCPFCGRSLVRTEYLSSKNMPESVVPFGITQKEAEERLEEWCRKNRGKQEAKPDEALAGRLGLAAEQALRFSFCHFRLLSIFVCLSAGPRAARFGTAICGASRPGLLWRAPISRVR